MGNIGTRHHLAIYLPSLGGGGAERVMVRLAGGFAERGFKVDLVLARAEGPYRTDVPDTVRVVDLGATRVMGSLPGLIRYLRQHRPDAMLSALCHANVLAVVARDLAGVATRLVVSEHNHLSASAANGKTLRERWLPHLMKWSYPKVDCTVAVSNGVADDLAGAIGLPRGSICVIHNPVPVQELSARAKERVEHPWFAPGADPVLLGVGRLTRQKDFPTLIQAFGRLRSSRPARLMILGEGEERPVLTALVRELGLEADVALPGFVANPFAYMGRAAAFVLSSQWEGFPNVLVEAMACGTPVISTDCPSGPAEILENGRWGRLVPVGDVAALATAMAETLDDPCPPDVMRRVRDFTVDRAVDKYLQALGMECARG